MGIVARVSNVAPEPLVNYFSERFKEAPYAYFENIKSVLFNISSHLKKEEETMS